MAKKLTGVVVSTAMDKTIVVRVEQQRRHSVYKKVMKRHKKVFAHVPSNEKPAVGSIVTIVEIRPVSKNTHFQVADSKAK